MTTTTTTTTTTDTTTTQPAVAPSLVVDGVDVGKAATDALGGLTTALGGVTDAATAQAAVTSLRRLPPTLDGLIAQTKLSPEQKAASLGTGACHHQPAGCRDQGDGDPWRRRDPRSR